MENNGVLVPPDQILVEGVNIKIQKQIKDLGIHFDFDLRWKTHFSMLVSKVQRMNSGLKVSRRSLNQEDIDNIAMPWNTLLCPSCVVS